MSSNMNNDTNDTNRFRFRLYELSLRAAKLCAPLFEKIARHDPDLAKQGRRALASSHLNISEGMDGVGGNRILRFRTALGSTNETIGCLDFATAVGYVEADPVAIDSLQHVRATLLNLVKRKR